MAYRRSTALLVCAALLLVVLNVSASVSATATLREFFARANDIILSPDPDFIPEARRHLIRTLAYEVFDFRAAAALALGAEWHARTPAERDEFTRLFADLLESGYVATIGSKASLSSGVSITFLGETLDDDTATVRTTLVTKNGSELPVDYQMVRAGSRWAVRDVVIDGMSLSANYRAQFQRVIRTSSYAGLLARMRERAPDAPHIAVAAVEPPAAPVAVERRPAVVEAPVTAPVASPAPVVTAVVAPRTPAAPPAVAVADRGPAVRAPSRQYWVQVGAFRDDEAAMRLMQRLRQQAVLLFSAEITSASGQPEPIVSVGPFTRLSEATSQVRELQASGYKPFIAEGRE